MSMELGPEDVSLLERCPHFRRYYVHLSCITNSHEIICHTFILANIISTAIATIITATKMLISYSCKFHVPTQRPHSILHATLSKYTHVYSAHTTGLHTQQLKVCPGDIWRCH